MNRNKWIFTALALLACLVWSVESSFARGGGGGGRAGGGSGRPGGGGGGMSRPGGGGGMSARPASGHSPSMSRPTPSPGGGNFSAGGGHSFSGGGNFSHPGGASSRPGGSMSKPAYANNEFSRPGGSTFKPGSSIPGTTTVMRPNTGGPSQPGSNFGGNRLPNASDVGSFLDMPKPGNGNFAGAGGASRPNFADRDTGFNRSGAGTNRPGDGSTFDNVLHNGGNRPTTLPANVTGNRPGNNLPGDHYRPGFNNNNWSNNKWASQVNNQWHNHWNNNNWNNNFLNINNGMYHPGWVNNYPRYRNGYWNYRPSYAYGWWTVASAASLGSWFGGGYGQPVYYDYGSGGNVYYQGDTVYVDGQATAAADYAASAQQLAATGADQLAQPPAEDSQTEWMPLGVFALSTSEDEKTPTRMLQMAVNKDGVINGTMYDTESKQSQPIVGAVDKDTQRACWYIGDNKDVVAETGIYNLTQDQASILVHYGSDRTEEYMLTRLDPPEEAKQANASQAVPAPPSGG